MTNLAKPLLHLLIFFIMLIGFPFAAFSQSMESEQYQLDYGDIMVEDSTPSSSGTVAKLSAAEQAVFDKQGFLVLSKTADPLVLSLETTLLSFGQPGSITPNVTNTAQITGTRGYQLNIAQSQPLTSFAERTLPNTSCDSSCSFMTAGKWEKMDKYGLGYTVLSPGTPLDFKNGTYFRALPEISKKEDSAIILENSVHSTSAVDITFRLVIPPDESQSYNTVVYIQALPTY